MEDEALQLKPNRDMYTVHGTRYTTADTAQRWIGGSIPTNMDLHGWERICTKGGKSLKGGGYAYVQGSLRRTYRYGKPRAGQEISYDDSNDDDDG